MQIPDDIVVGAAVERENAEFGLAPVDSVVALGITGQVTAVVIDERAPIAIGGGAMVVIGFLVAARHVETGNLMIAVGKAPVWTHAAEIPHPVFAPVVQYRAIEVDPPAQTRAAILPGLVRIGLHHERHFRAGLDLALDAVCGFDERLVEQQHALIRRGRV